MKEIIRVIFVQDSLQEQVVAQEGNALAILDRAPMEAKEVARYFYLSTTMDISMMLVKITRCKRTLIAGNLVRYELYTSKKELVDLLLNNFDSLHFNE